MSYYEFTITISDILKDTLVQRLSEAGCLGMIENDECLICYFPSSIDIEAIRNDLSLFQTLLDKAGRTQALSYHYQVIPDKDWNETWKKDFKPVDAGERFTIIPPWEKERPGRINLVIDPGMAFGTGHHETTRSCLILMDKYAGAVTKDLFLDLGTGTGILAIAAALLGFQKVYGIDTDPLAVSAAKDNVGLNRVSGIKIREGTITDLDLTFDMIAANLISTVLVLLSAELSLHLNPSGLAILSGILIGQEHEVIEACGDAGLTVREHYKDGKWISLVVEKKAA